jgi:UDP-glucuronate decarboxylase
MTASPAKRVYKPLPPDDPVKRKPDISRARELLQWQPTVPLTNGLQETIPYFRTKLLQNNYQVVASGNG